MIDMVYDGSALKMTHLFQEADLILTNSASQVGEPKNIRFTDYCGEFFTAPGFGLWLAIEHLKVDKHLKKILLHHAFGPQEMVIQVKRVS